MGTILIVDDSRAMRMIIRRTLRLAGFGEYTIAEATNGQEALGIIRGKSLSLVLADWNMPVMNGPELLAQINAEGMDVNFGFVTTEGTPEMRKRAADAGALFLVAKPFTVETLQASVSQVLS